MRSGLGVDGEHDRDSGAVRVARERRVFLQQAVEAALELLAMGIVQLEPEAAHSNVVWGKRRDLLQECLDEYTADARHACRPRAFGGQIRHLAGAPPSAPRLFRPQKARVNQRSHVVQRASWVEIQRGGNLFVRVRLVQANPKDAHAQRRRERAGTRVLVVVIRHVTTL